MNNMKISSNI